MAIQERVTNYSVAMLRNGLRGISGGNPPYDRDGKRGLPRVHGHAPAEWPQINGPNAIVLLERTQFDRIHHLVQSESPLFVTAMQVFFGLVFNLSTSPELPGEGPADNDALVELAGGHGV